MAICLAGLGLLTACTSVPNEAVTPVATPKISKTLVLAQNGIRVGATGQEISFGRTQASTVATVSRLIGAAPITANATVVPGCGETVTWRKGLTLTFMQGDFRGWSNPSGTYQTVSSALSAGRTCG